ncbi:hypothetical protein BK133_11770 [Paenibacillus sp. FSL H8-0548]|uniref:IS66 family transposase n=1 Tax=Paenibacillus sp. FSL H8-0548 TaxID=1920422 RepID=UPI00096C6F29|nr:hypothetical protein BK133_11770 [Paenibacillus sp. FSL H8-0548]
MEERYDDILADGYHEWADPGITEQVRTKGRKKKSKATNLGQRFQLHKEAILRFIRDARVPFDNNQAERDIRMAKVKVKVSDSYRSKSNAERFARIRCAISTLTLRLELRNTTPPEVRARIDEGGTSDPKGVCFRGYRLSAKECAHALGQFLSYTPWVRDLFFFGTVY